MFRNANIKSKKKINLCLNKKSDKNVKIDSIKTNTLEFFMQRSG